jgi:PBP1b-binding outer membrane lipoprotein LpoB
MAYTEANGLQEVSKMMKRFTSFLFLALFLLIMLGCSDDDPTGEVNVEWDQQVDFTQFQTFGIVLLPDTFSNSF